VDRDGCFLGPDRCAEMFALADHSENKYPVVGWQEMGKIEHAHTAGQEHIDALLSLSFVDVELIRSKKFKVCLDSVNGSYTTHLFFSRSHFDCCQVREAPL